MGRTLSGPLAGSRFVPFLPSSWSLSAACGSGSRSSGATPVSGPPPPSASSTPAGQPTSISRLQMQLHLRGLQNSTSDLRSQLQQLRKLQVRPALGPRPVPRPLATLPLTPKPLPTARPVVFTVPSYPFQNLTVPLEPQSTPPEPFPPVSILRVVPIPSCPPFFVPSLPLGGSPAPLLDPLCYPFLSPHSLPRPPPSGRWSHQSGAWHRCARSSRGPRARQVRIMNRDRLERGQRVAIWATDKISPTPAIAPTQP